MFGAGAVAGLALYAELRFGGVELIAHDRGSGVAGEAGAGFGGGHSAPSGGEQAGRPRGRGAGSDVERVR